jgi:phospholipid/cholesterol/gamma-HCH transport system substrate-binding protein
LTRRTLEIRVGITVLIASTILIVGIMWFQKFKLVEKRYSIYVSFPEVGGLTEDDPIDVNGVERGRVETVHLNRQNVVVGMGVSDGVAIPVDSRVSLRSVGIMGERFITIKTGASATNVQPGDTLSGEFDAGMSEVLGYAGNVLGELNQATQELRSILESVKGDDKLKTSMDNLQEVSSDLRSLTTDSKPRLTTAIRNFERVAAHLDSLITRRYAALDSSMESMGRAGGQFESAVNDLSATSAALKEITDRLQSGEGTLGKLLTEEEFLNKLDKTVTNLDSLITDIKLHPGRYFSVHLF